MEIDANGLSVVMAAAWSLSSSWCMYLRKKMVFQQERTMSSSSRRSGVLIGRIQAVTRSGRELQLDVESWLQHESELDRLPRELESRKCFKLWPQWAGCSCRSGSSNPWGSDTAKRSTEGRLCQGKSDG